MFQIKLPEGEDQSYLARIDEYRPTPGAGLIFSYIIGIVSIVMGVVIMCYSSDEYSDPTLMDDYDDGRRPSMPLSMISGYQSRPTYARKVSNENQLGSKHSIVDERAVPYHVPDDYI